MIKAFYLYTGPDGHSHVTPGSVILNETLPAETVLYEESAPHAHLDWHNAPTTQFVITLAGILEFTTHTGETFTIHPGDILIALDTTGSGHKWRLTNDQPWRRAYVAFKKDTKLNFQPDPK
jgi:quercetin dioxygenase-like cupin family protein